MTIPAHPHRTHSSQRSRKRKRYKPRPAVSIRKEMEPVPQTAEKPVQAGFFACVKFILMRWFK
jgi:hypothetical protein